MTCALRNLARRHQQQVCQCLQDRRCRGRGRGAVRAVVQVQAELTRRRLLLLREGSGSAGHAYPPRESIPHRMTQAGRDALDRVSVQATARLREQQPAGRFPCVRNRRHRTSRGAKSGRTPAVPRPAQSPIRACVPHRARVKPARKEGAKDIRSANHAVGMWNESRSADRLKILFWDGSGLVMAYKRLEADSFTWPAIRDGAMTLSRTQFEALFAGLDWRRVRPLETPKPAVSE
ncbi:hypothetical protein CDV52_20680 [Haematobacter missouriensis]|nr:hypothetical protein CDV49_18515 [Haematobacter genomosp. 1]OWJ80870.1 hypothetical protein CDV52_20680 [Haematobacter missouriensis]OWJ82031.1 hypothetical protein CDV51_18595 [Haematobacter massiliensis]